MGNSITAHVAEALGKKNSKSLFNYIHISTRTIAAISLVTVSMGLIWYAITALDMELFGKNMDSILIIATLVIAIKFWELLYQSILKGYERYDLASIYNMISKLLVLAAQLAIVMDGFGLMEIFISNLILNFLMVIVQAVVSYKQVDGYRFSFSKSKEESSNLFHFGLWTWLQTIISVVAYQLDRFVVAIFLGPAVTGYYILASTIINHMHMAFGAIVSWLLPKISRKKETEANITIYFTTLRSFLIGLSLIAVLLTYFLYEPVFTLWLGPDKFGKMSSFFKLFLIFEAFLLMTIVPLFYLNAIKMLKFITSLELMYKTGVIIGLLVAFAIVPTGDSIIIGQIIALLVFIPVEYYYINKKILFSNSFRETVLTIIPSVMVSLAILLSQWYLTLVFILVAAAVFKFYFLNPKIFNRKLLME
jgi:O-antigen/teichoic acid export membrane protein